MVEPQNPYAAPKTAARAQRRNVSAADLDGATLRALRSKSIQLNILGGLMAFFTALCVFALLVFCSLGPRLPRNGQGIIIVVLVVTVIYATSMLSAWLRPSWGRVPLVVVCLLSLPSFPLGTALGAFGLFALQGTAKLFGPNRCTHGQLDREFQMRSARPSLRRNPANANPARRRTVR